MKKFRFGIIIAVLSVLLLSCNNSNSVTAEEGGIQIDPELKELGELNALILQYDDAGDKLGDCIAVKSKKKWGLINLKGDTILDFKYDRIKRIKDEEYWNVEVKNVEASRYSEWYDVGIADAKGVIIVKPIKGNQSIGPYGEGLYLAYDGKVEPHLYNEKGEEIILGYGDDESSYDFPLLKIEKYSQNCFVVHDGYAWYRMTHDKGAKPEFKIDSIMFLNVMPSTEYCFVQNEDEKWGAINPKGDTIAPFEYLDTKKLGNDNVFVKNEEGKWGMFNGKEVSAFYDDFYMSIDDYSKGEDAGTQIILDKQGKELFRSDDLINYPFYSNGMFLGKHSLYDSKGNTIITLNDSLHVLGYLNDYIIVGTDSRNYGIANKKGELVIPPTNYANPDIPKGGSLIRLTKNISDVFVNNERIIVNVTDIFDTSNGTLSKTIFDLSMKDFVDGLSLGEIEGRHVYVNEQGKTGILNLEEILKSLAEQKEMNKQQEQKESIEHIKEQLVKSINEANGRKILSGTYSIHDFEKCEDGTYKAEFFDHGEYETITYEIYNIKTDKDGNLVDYELKLTMIRPTSKKPDGGIKTVDEIVNHTIGAVGY